MMIIIYFLIYYFTNVILCSKPTYKLTSGTYEAIEIKLSNDKLVHRLMNIPYAATPYMFQKSTELLNRTSNYVEKANQWPNMCVQTRIFNAEFYGNLLLPHKTFMSFDCLTINLYIPAQAKNLSVMMFIHGGSNAVGTSSYIDATALASYGNVVVVTVNYRLDVMGFFNMPGSKRYKGNYGLWDQLAAIKWLYNNCINIGCNKDSITLFGHSAGSANVQFHALSKYTQPYIKRIIMQSGSGLAHWAINYEKYIIDVETSSRAIELFKKSRYAKTVNDTLVNFLSVTKCNQTTKNKCLKEKLKLFLKANKHFNQSKLENEINRSNHLNETSDDLIDLLIMKSFWNLVNVVKFNDISVMFGYIFKLKFNLILNSTRIESNQTLDELYKRFNNWNELHHKEKHLIPRMKQILKEKSFLSQQNNDQEDNCFLDLQMLIENYEHTYEICYFLKEISVIDTIGLFPHKPLQTLAHGDQFIKSKIIQFFLACFTEFYQDKSSVLFELNDKLILSELEQCANEAVNDKNETNLNKPIFEKKVDEEWTDYELISENEEEDFRSTQDNSIYGGPKSTLIVKEIAWLSDNTNNLHRASIDNDYIEDFPQLSLSKNSNTPIDIMVGITKHEAFYFLEYNYNFDDVLKHAFIYSSLLNLTTDLINKLIVLDTNTGVNICLKKRLLNYYDIDTHYLKGHPNNLVKSHLTLNLINDFEFILPLTTHLKLELNKNEKAKTDKKIFAYQFNFESSFNYMLNRSMPYSDVYKTVYKYMNNSVVPHFSELDYVFGLPILSRENRIKYKNKNLNYEYTQHEYDLSIQMIKYWSNFAKYGDPNYGIKNTDEKWYEFNSSNPNILNINQNGVSLNKSIIKIFLDKHKFWYESLTNKEYADCYLNKATRSHHYLMRIFNLFICYFFVKKIN